jgi:hypothetical protein
MQEKLFFFYFKKIKIIDIYCFTVFLKSGGGAGKD